MYGEKKQQEKRRLWVRFHLITKFNHQFPNGDGTIIALFIKFIVPHAATGIIKVL
jgi:hypothetical protein